MSPYKADSLRRNSAANRFCAFLHPAVPRHHVLMSTNVDNLVASLLNKICILPGFPFTSFTYTAYTLPFEPFQVL